jgi:hypothetical protein
LEDNNNACLQTNKKKRGSIHHKGTYSTLFWSKARKGLKIFKPRSTCNYNHLKRIQLQNVGSRSGSPESWVDRVLPGRCTGRSFNKPEPVQPPGWLGPGSTCRAGLCLITANHSRVTYFYKSCKFHELINFLKNKEKINKMKWMLFYFLRKEEI